MHLPQVELLIFLRIHSISHFYIYRFLRILKLLVQDPAGADKAFLPSVISFVMSQIHPLVSEQPNSDILLVLYELFYQLLLNNWRWVDLFLWQGHWYYIIITSLIIVSVDISFLVLCCSTWIVKRQLSQLNMRWSSSISWRYRENLALTLRW